MENDVTLAPDSQGETVTNKAIPNGNLIKKPRNASFELARIIAMLFIISHHFFLHGNWQGVTSPVNAVLVKIVETLFLPSVNIFVLISAYFLSTKDEVKFEWKKLLRLWVPVSFYSIVLFIIFTATGVVTFNVRLLLQAIFPVLLDNYWFFSAYFLMLLVSPLLNVIVHRLNFKQFTVVVAIIVAVAALQDAGVFGTLPLYNGYNGIWFCLRYFIAAYIRKFNIRFNDMAQGLAIVMYVALVVISYFSGGHYTSLNTVIMSVILLLTFQHIKIEKKGISRIICGISKTTFGIYLIHDNPLMRGFMYQGIFHSAEFYSSDFSFLIFLGFIFATFAVCAIAEFLRGSVFGLIETLAVRIKDKHKNDVALR